MKYLLPLLLIAFLLPTRGRAAEQPDWKQLQQLLGQPIVAKQVVDFVKTNELRKGAKGGSGSFAAPQQSYTVMFERDTVSTIVLHPAPWLKGFGGTDWTPYTNALPAGLSPGDSRKAVERKLGSPTEPGSHWWEHGEVTIWVMFNQQGSAIEQLYVWRTRDNLTALHTSTAAEEQTATQLVQRIQASLPKGWAVSFEKEYSWLEFSRMEPVLRVHSGPNLSGVEEPVRDEFAVGFRVVPYITPSDYQRIKAENNRLEKEANALYEDLRKRQGRSEGGLQSESSTDAEKRDVARLEQIKKSIRMLPDYYFRDISLKWEFPMFTRYPYAEVLDPVIRKECERTQREVLRLVSTYDAD